MSKSISQRDFITEGDYVIPFAGIDQNGNFFQFRDYYGKVIIINFIFTRCQAQKMCPASTMRMSLIQDQARRENLDVQFLSISFDPEYDSPGILSNYAESYNIESDTFTFMTANSETIDSLMRYFGIIRILEDGTINHTMATLMINQKGRVAYRKEGSQWEISDFLERAKAILKN